MKMQLGTDRYWTTYFEDLKDGFAGIRLHRETFGQTAVAAEVIFWDATGGFTIQTFDRVLQVEAARALITEAEDHISTGVPIRRRDSVRGWRQVDVDVMTQDTAIQKAGRLARELDWPWDEDSVTVRSWRIWPFARMWKVTSLATSEGARSTLRLNGRTGRMTFGRVTYRTP